MKRRLTPKQIATCRKPLAHQPTTIRGVVNEYIRTYRPHLQEDLRFYGCQPTLRAAIDLASLAVRSDGKRQNHQRRIPESALRRARASLQRSHLHRCRSFAELHEVISEATSRIPRIGPLTRYDTALRIGSYLKLKPKLVYLHAGTREGARALGLDTARPEISPAKLPTPFRNLKPHEIEDCLCIFKSCLHEGSRLTRRCS